MQQNGMRDLFLSYQIRAWLSETGSQQATYVPAGKHGVLPTLAIVRIMFIECHQWHAGHLAK